MIDNTHQAIQHIAGRTGWSDYALVLLIAQWADETGQARALVEYLDQIATDGEETDALG